MRYLEYSIYILIISCFAACNSNSKQLQPKMPAEVEDQSQAIEEKAEFVFEIVKTPEEWKQELNDAEYYVIREKGTERSFTGEYWDNKAEGVYTCKACDLELFASGTKFKSGTGWPSFYEPLLEENIAEDTDYNLGYARTEVMCNRCGGHLGHVFNDGPRPTGLRYCINSVSLNFKAK